MNATVEILERALRILEGSEYLVRYNLAHDKDRKSTDPSSIEQPVAVSLEGAIIRAIADVYSVVRDVVGRAVLSQTDLSPGMYNDQSTMEEVQSVIRDAIVHARRTESWIPERERGRALCVRVGAPKTAQLLGDYQQCYASLFASAIAEIGIDAFVEALVSEGYPLWIAMALRHIDLADSHIALLRNVP